MGFEPQGRLLVVSQKHAAIVVLTQRLNKLVVVEVTPGKPISYDWTYY